MHQRELWCVAPRGKLVSHRIDPVGEDPQQPVCPLASCAITPLPALQPPQPNSSDTRRTMHCTYRPHVLALRAGSDQPGATFPALHVGRYRIAYGVREKKAWRKPTGGT